MSSVSSDAIASPVTSSTGASDHSLNGRVALISGGAAGIGRACVQRFIADGCRVVVLERDSVSASALQKLATDVVAFHLGDATVDHDVEAAVAHGLDLWGRIDVLVNAAGGFTEVPAFESLAAEEWTSVVDLNLTSAFLCSRAVVPTMRSAGFGRIVNVASMAGRTGLPDISHAYSAAKAGMIGLTRSLALDVAPAGITVNAVAPGVVWTPRVAKVHEHREQALRAATPVGRLGDPDDIADAIWYLARPSAGYVTGAVIDINGGRFMA